MSTDSRLIPINKNEESTAKHTEKESPRTLEEELRLQTSFFKSIIDEAKY